MGNKEDKRVRVILSTCKAREYFSTTDFIECFKAWVVYQLKCATYIK